MLFTVKGRKFKFFAQEKDLAPFFSNGNKLKIPSAAFIKENEP